MFGLGISEVLVILFLGIIILGPKRIPGFARNLGKIVRELKLAKESLMSDTDSHTGYDSKPFKDTPHDPPGPYSNTIKEKKE